MSTNTVAQDISVREFRHSSTQGFYLVQGRERVATATQSPSLGWRLVWNVGQGSPITGDTPLDLMTQALDAWPAVKATIETETPSGWGVPAELAVSRSSTPMGGQPGYRRR
jgi:hypothetical protein